MRDKDRIFEFETVLDGDVGADPTPPAPPAGWQGPSQEEWQNVMGFQSLILDALAEDTDTGDPVTPDLPNLTDPAQARAFMETVANQRAEQLYKERFAPFEPILNDVAKEKGKEMVVGELDRIAKGDPASGRAGIGEFDREQATIVAQAYFAQGIPADKAIRLAAENTLAHEQRIRASSLGAERQQMQHRFDAGWEPRAGARAGEETPPVPSGRDKYEQIAADWLAKSQTRGPSPVG